MDKSFAWKLFKHTGSVEAYLMYKELVKQEFSEELGDGKSYPDPASFRESSEIYAQRQQSD